MSEHDPNKSNLKNKEEDFVEKFINSIFEKIQNDKGFRANLKRADNQNLESLSWPFFLAFGIDIAKIEQRLPAALVAASIARNKALKNGDLSLSAALASCYPQEKEDERIKSPAGQRMRRICSCESIEELFLVLRPILRLIESKSEKTIDYVDLYKKVRNFSDEHSRQRAKIRWMQDFLNYGKKISKVEKNDVCNSTDNGA